MFSHVVNLYRAAGRPELKDGSFSYSGTRTPALVSALQDAGKLPDHYGRFGMEPDSSGDDVEFSWHCGANEEGRFYPNADALIVSSRTLSRGEIPKNSYLVDVDHSFGEATIPEVVKRLIHLCELIQLLSRLSLISDSEALDRPRSLIFVMPAGDGQPPKTLELATKITRTCLGVSPPDLDLIRAVAANEQDHKLHWHEYRSLFRIAIASVLQGAPAEESRFDYLVANWHSVLERYRYDVDCFVENFSFDKLRLEISKNSLDFSSKLTSVMGDNTGKFLGLPLPILAIAGIAKAGTLNESAILLVSTLAIAVVFSGTIKNQFIQLRQIEAGFTSAFDKLLSPSANVSQPIKRQIDETTLTFNQQRALLRRVLWFLRIGAWLPAIAGTLVIAYRFNPAVQSWVLLHLPS